MAAPTVGPGARGPSRGRAPYGVHARCAWPTSAVRGVLANPRYTQDCAAMLPAEVVRQVDHRLPRQAGAGRYRVPQPSRKPRPARADPTDQLHPRQTLRRFATITLRDDDHLRERQEAAYGSTCWLGYHRRVAVESGYAELKRHRASIRRGFTRVFGTTKNLVLLAYAVAGVNQRILRAWYATSAQPEPWAEALGETFPEATRRKQAGDTTGPQPRAKPPDAQPFHRRLTNSSR